MNNLQTYNVHLHSKRFTQKPAWNHDTPWNSEGHQIHHNITNQTVAVTPKELAEALAAGQTILPYVMRRSEAAPVKRSRANFDYTEVLLLDFDNDTDEPDFTIDQAKENAFLNQYASFGYETFSSTTDNPRFRVVFFLEERLTSEAEVDQAVGYLLDRYPMADPATKDTARLFYGGRNPFVFNYANTLPESVYETFKPVKKVSIPEKKKRAPQANYTPLEGQYPVYELLRRGMFEEAKEILKPVVEEQVRQHGTNTRPSKWDFYDYFRNWDMQELLQLPETSPFTDLFTEDNNPSATVGINPKTNTWQYTRFGDDRSYDVIHLTRRLLGSQGEEASMSRALDVLINITGSTIATTKEIESLKDQVNQFKKLLLSGTLKEEHPELHHIFGRYDCRPEVNAILDIMVGHLHEGMDGQPGFTFESLETIAHRLGIGRKSAERTIDAMVAVGLVQKHKDSALPEELLTALKNAQNHPKGDARPRKYRVNVYQLNPMMDLLHKVESLASELVDNQFSRGKSSREWFLTYMPEHADRIYPQDSHRKTISKKTRDFERDMEELILHTIQDQGHILVNDVKDALQEKWHSKGFTEYKFNQRLKLILDGYALQRVSLTNALKEQFGYTHLSPYARPSLIMPEE